MTTPFQDAVAASSAAVDAVYGEPYRYQPMTCDTDPNARMIIDGSRAVLTITCTMVDIYARADSAASRTQGVIPEKPGHASDRPSVSIDRVALPYDPRKGDRLTRLSDGVLFQVAEPRIRDTTRVFLDLNRL